MSSQLHTFLSSRPVDQSHKSCLCFWILTPIALVLSVTKCPNYRHREVFLQSRAVSAARGEHVAEAELNKHLQYWDCVQGQITLGVLVHNDLGSAFSYNRKFFFFHSKRLSWPIMKLTRKGNVCLWQQEKSDVCTQVLTDKWMAC